MTEPVLVFAIILSVGGALAVASCMLAPRRTHLMSAITRESLRVLARAKEMS